MKVPHHSRFLVLFIKNTRIPRILFSIVFLFANALGVYLEFQRNIPLLAYLDLAMTIIGVMALFISFLRPLRYNTIIFFVLLWIGIALEIETQLYDPMGSYDDPRVAWAPYLVLFLSILFFPFKPSYFTAYWISVFLYSFVRFFIHDPADVVLRRILVLCTNAYPAALFFISFYYWWYRLNDLNFHQKVEIVSLRNRLIEQERRNIYRDIHNYMGADLTHLLSSIQSLPEQNEMKKIKEQLRRNIYALIASLQSGISRTKDLEALRNNWIQGLKEILIRRYSYSGRSVLFLILVEEKNLWLAG